MSRSAWLAAVRSGAVPSRLAAFGAVGVAAAVVAAPVAHAGTPAPATTSTGGSTPPGPGADIGTSGRTLKAAEPLDDAGAPQYGNQKIRVGVQREDGATFPADSTLIGATIKAVQTDQDGKVVSTTTCTVTSDPLHPEQSEGSGVSANETAADDSNTIADCDFGDDYTTDFGGYDLEPGDSVTFTETSPPDGPGMLPDENSYTVGSCNDPTADATPLDAGQGGAKIPPDCVSFLSPELAAATASARAQARPAVAVGGMPFNGGAVVFVVRPVPPPPPAPPAPSALDDSATTPAGTSVAVPVLANDDANGGGALSISSVGAPAHGAAVVDGPDVQYTPVAGFVGTDTFTYTATTPYGSSTATVTVTVTPPPVASPTPTTSAPTSPSLTATPTTSAAPSRGVLPTSASRAPGPPLANTGIRTGDYLGVGAGLVALGGLLTITGRRRRRAH